MFMFSLQNRPQQPKNTKPTELFREMSVFIKKEKLTSHFAAIEANALANYRASHVENALFRYFYGGFDFCREIS